MPRQVELKTPLADEELKLKHFRGHEELGRPFQYELELVSRKHDIEFSGLIGEMMEVRLYVRGKWRIFTGLVSRFSQTTAGQEKNLAFYRATLVPTLWLLTRSSDCQIFLPHMFDNNAMSADAIIKKVLGEFGVEFDAEGLSATYPKREYCVQYRETHFNFVSRLMEEEGIYYYFTHKDGKHIMHLADSRAAHNPYDGFAEIPYRQASGGSPMVESITDCSLHQEIQPGAYTLSDYDFTVPKKDLVVSADAVPDWGHSKQGNIIYDYPGSYAVRDAGDHYARVRIDELQAQVESLRAQSDARGIEVGRTFTMKSHPRGPMNREYLITSASYRIDAEQLESGAGGSPDDAIFSVSFAAMSIDVPFHPARLTPRPVVRGVQTAIVVGKAGDEIHTDEYGRIKVHFHWDRWQDFDEKCGIFIRVAQEWAGKGWGSIFTPRVGQEVIVDFLEGDPDRPLITGRVYNGDHKPPYELPAHATRSTIKTNSSKGSEGFNELRFEDKKGEEQIFIHAEKNMDERVKNNSMEWIGNDRHLIVKRDQVEQVERDRSEIVKRDHIEKIERDRSLKVTGKEAIEITGSRSLKVTGALIEEFKDKHSEVTTKDHYIKADNICIEALTNITIKVGQTSIALEADGIKISTKGKIEVESLDKTEFKTTAGDFKVESQMNASIKGTIQLNLEGTVQAEMKGAMATVKGDAMTTIKGGIVMIN
ncbi:MAG: type VI secretion system Vgr family protein [Phycisphaerales bacterium]